MTQLEFVQQARWYATHYGYKQSWVYVVFRKKYGVWPNDLFKAGTPQVASDEFRQWVLADQTGK
jgi:hypothetical protein